MIVLVILKALSHAEIETASYEKTHARHKEAYNDGDDDNIYCVARWGFELTD